MIDYKEGMHITAPSYIRNMPADIYHAHNSISNSGLKLVGRSPAHFKYQPEKPETRNKVLGSALHMGMLEPDLFYKKYTLLSNAKDRVCRLYRDAKEQFGEEFVLVASECAKVEGIIKSLWSNAEISYMLSRQGHGELSGFSTDPETGVMCRHRFDKITNSGIGIDIKTTIDARPEAFSKFILNYGYHMQNAFYADQYEWITGKQLEDFVFIVVESESPYACKMYRLDQESIDIGRSQYRSALNEYAAALESGIWDSYGCNGIEEISIPQWAINKYDFEQVEAMTFTGE